MTPEKILWNFLQHTFDPNKTVLSIHLEGGNLEIEFLDNGGNFFHRRFNRDGTFVELA